MALVAGLVRIEFRIDIADMHILMTIRALLPDIPELPFFIRIALVTGKTWSCHVPAIKGKFCFCVVVDRE